jgi:putative ABC transport system substrate-binding protein
MPSASGDTQDSELAGELGSLKVDLIVTTGASAVRALRRATPTTPIVMANYVGDPIADGIVTTLARPGGNITGLIPLAPELSAKRVQFLQEMIPKLSRVAVIWKPDESGARLQWQQTQAAATTLGLQLLSLEVRTTGDLDHAFETVTRNRADALMVLRDDFTFTFRKRIITAAARNRLPAIHPMREFVEAGGPPRRSASLCRNRC